MYLLLKIEIEKRSLHEGRIEQGGGWYLSNVALQILQRSCSHRLFVSQLLVA